MNKYKLLSTSFILLILVCSIVDAVHAQESVAVPEQLTEVDIIFHDVEKAHEEHQQIRNQKGARMNSLREQYESETENQQLKRYYYAEYRRAEADVLLLDYKYYREIKQFGLQVNNEAAEFRSIVNQTDFGENIAINNLSEINENISNIQIRQKNQTIISEYGRLTEEEIRWLSEQVEFQNQVMSMWLNERRWYSTQMNQIREQHEQLSEYVQFSMMMTNYADKLVRKAEQELNKIESRVYDLQQELENI